MNAFFVVKEIEIDCGIKGCMAYTMRPLTVAEFTEYATFARKHTEYTNKYLLELIAIIGKTLTPGIESVPEAALKGLIDVFLEFNFPKDVRRKTEVDGELEDYELARAFDFLINEGHLESEIMAYPLPRFRLYIEAASDRITGNVKKKVDPLAVFQKLGIPIMMGGM